MNTQNMKFVVVVVCLAVCVGTAWGDLLGSAKATAEEAKDAAAPTLNAAKDSAASTANSAKDAAESTASSAKDAAAPAFEAAAPTVEAATEKSESFAWWAYEKISSGLGLKTEDEKQKLAQNAKYNTK